MEIRSCGDVCRLLCCPPCPSSIAAKLAFLPPTPSTYSIEHTANNSCAIHLGDHAEWQYNKEDLSLLDMSTQQTKRGNVIVCMYVKCDNPAPGKPSQRWTILFSHGNAVDIGQMASFYVGLARMLDCNIFSYDYSGYGQSRGKASESNMYADVEAAWDALRSRYAVDVTRVVLYGQSIGSVPTVHLATKFQVGGVVLHSGLLSGLRVAFPGIKRTWCCDPFRNIEKISKVPSTVLVIHGTEDEVIDFHHGVQLYERAPCTVKPLWIEGAGHNDVEFYEEYRTRLKDFFFRELTHE